MSLTLKKGFRFLTLNDMKNKPWEAFKMKCNKCRLKPFRYIENCDTVVTLRFYIEKRLELERKGAQG